MRCLHLLTHPTARLAAGLAAWARTVPPPSRRHDAHRGQTGAQTVEYALLIALVAIVLLVALRPLFDDIAGLIDRAREGISRLGGSPGSPP